MIIIVEKEKFLSSEYNCKYCRDTGRIKVYRFDWEDFDEIKCEDCKSD